MMTLFADIGTLCFVGVIGYLAARALWDIFRP
jgi:hypothetical protein